jgi:monoamine oxidase
MEPREAEVLVLGAGMAGLTAARVLTQRGLRVTVLEARERVGGRIHSVLSHGSVVELGAEFVHGRPEELWALVAEAGLETVERDGSMVRAADGVVKADEDDAGEMFAPLETLVAQAQQPGFVDEPFAAWLARQSIPRWQAEAVTGFVEGFNAADARRIGTASLAAQQTAEDQAEGDRAWHLCGVGGYAQLPEYLAAQVRAQGGDIVLGQPVSEVRWQRGEVRVVTRHGDEFRAQQCIVALPLGVVQRVNRGGVSLVPEPAAITSAHRLAMGDAVRFTMVFRSAWWQQMEALQTLSFLFTAGTPRVWWTARPEAEPSPTLTAWVGGPKAASLRGRSAAQLAALALQELSTALGLPATAIEAELLTTHSQDWASDEFSLGAYSYVPAGAMLAPAAAGQSAEQTLYFCGEHTDVTAHWGTVHAAMRSGLRVADEVVRSRS